MHAFLTFIRKNNQDIHMLGIKNPENIIELSKFNLKSGQPIIAVVIDKVLLSLYILDSLGNIMQIYGKNDSLFELNKIYDLSLVNLKKYNYIKTLLINSFSCLSIEESKYKLKDLEDLEDRIFCNILHLKIDLYKCKRLVIREINKSNIDNDLKIRLIYNIRKNKISNRKILRKKIDIDLQGYSINIDTLIP
jgi:hypothetical protein